MTRLCFKVKKVGSSTDNVKLNLDVSTVRPFVSMEEEKRTKATVFEITAIKEAKLEYELIKADPKDEEIVDTRVIFLGSIVNPWSKATSDIVYVVENKMMVLIPQLLNIVENVTTNRIIDCYGSILGSCKITSNEDVSPDVKGSYGGQKIELLDTLFDSDLTAPSIDITANITNIAGIKYNTGSRPAFIKTDVITSDDEKVSIYNNDMPAIFNITFEPKQFIKNETLPTVLLYPKDHKTFSGISLEYSKVADKLMVIL